MLNPTKIITATLATMAFASPVMAAEGDMWNGFNAGINIGYGTLDSDWFDREDDWSGATTTYRGEGMLFGISGGYDRVIDGLLVGAVLDVDFTTIEDEERYDSWVNVSNKVNFIASLRARSGLVVNSSALYLTAGLAMGDIEHSWQEDGDPNDSWDFSNDNIGYVVGVGLEHYVKSNISVRAEILQYNLGTSQEANTNGYTQVVRDSLTTFKIGANYHF